MIILDRAQSLSLRRAATSCVLVRGTEGTGKSSLANAIAVQTAAVGLTCLLAGASPELDKPLDYKLARPCHPIIARRALVNSRSAIRRKQIDPIEARGRVDPAAMRIASRALRHARGLIQRHGLNEEEVEHSLAAGPLAPHALDLLTIVAQDASRIAQILWSGNRRSGRSLNDVENVIAGRTTDVPPDEGSLALILADDTNFERRLSAILGATQYAGERDLGMRIAGLRNPIPADKTLREAHEHIAQTTQLLRDALDLVRSGGGLEAALVVEPSSHASKIVEFFLRKRPGDGADAAVKFFENVMRQFEEDEKALAPYLERYGARSIASFEHTELDKPIPFRSDFASAGSYVQNIREARYAANQLPGRTAQLRAILSAPLVKEIAGMPIEETVKSLDRSTMPDERAKATQEVRHLRDLFASTGFGDLFAAPADFARKSDESLADQSTATIAGYSSGVLDLLLDATMPSAFANSSTKKEWPPSVTRARTQSELKDIASRGDRFDVLVADDADAWEESTLDKFAAVGTRVHLIGTDKDGDVVILDIPHRQTNFEIADLASQRRGYWLAGPRGSGLVVRETAGAELESLRSEAARLIISLQDLGRDVVLADGADGTVADFVVAVFDELTDAGVLGLAKRAREGIFILCRRDMRRPVSPPERSLPEDAITARSLGWGIKRASAEGVVLEKDGRAVALVDEPVALTGSEDLVIDVVDRLSALGWCPLVAWRDAPRDPDGLQRLLARHSLSLDGEDAFRAVAEFFGLSQSAPQLGEDLHHIKVRPGPEAEGSFGVLESSSDGGGHPPLKTPDVIRSADQKSAAGGSGARDATSLVRVVSVAISPAATEGAQAPDTDPDKRARSFTAP